MSSHESRRVRATAVRIRYDHISHSWRRATAERGAALIGN
jgi:hypothetical protein